MFGDGLDPEEWGLEGTDFEHNGSEVEEGEPLPSLQHVSDQEAPGPAMPEDVDTGSGPPPTLASQSNRAFFESSFISNAKFCDIKLPWETGVAQQIFSDSVLTTPVTPMVGISDLEHVPPQHAVETVVDDTVSQTMIVQTSAVIYTSVVQNLDDKTYDEQRDSLMDAAICKLLIVLRHSLLASVVGRQIIALGSEQQQLEGIVSDLAKVHSIAPDFNSSGGFLEIRTSHHKTSKTAERRAQLMPILIPARGVDGKVWLDVATEIFDELGLVLEGPVGKPLFPAPSHSHRYELFCKRPMTTGEASAFLRALVGILDKASDEHEQIVTSHSAKATVLTWAAKFGLSENSRSIVGRHASATTGTYAFYSRDLCVAPTRELQSIVDAIYNGDFNPDAPRSAYFAKRQDTSPEAGQQAASEAAELVVLDDSSSESSSGDADSPESSCNEEPPMKVKRFRPRVPKSESWYVHRKSHILHLLPEQDECLTYRYLACGKRLTDAYSLSSEATAWNVMCKLVHELTSLKTPDRILDIEANKIVVKDKEDKLEVPAHTSLQVLEALKRRGIALDFGDCMGFIEHDRYVQTFFEHLHREPPQGYQRCTIAQIVNADKEAWRKVIEQSVKPRRDATGVRPLDVQLMQALTSYEVSFSLIPLSAKVKPEPKPN
ncbi:Protein translocase subunit SecA [Durusdinium trenchii]|uniref:Protein translocase subunit SecA n=1 Tax=Durusdinium trenchii TaxID=1381693 RepID=A0ABP0K750_9DINO